MKAFLLAAGIGSRLRPLTDQVPKCMLEIGGRPMLALWLDAFGRAGVDEVLVNVHHLPDVVQGYLEKWSRPPRVRAVYEPELLGSAGTLLANRHWVEREEFFLACNADNLTDFEVSTLVDAHRRRHSLATIGVFRSERPSACGIVDLDGDGRIVSFVEKPHNPVSNLANAGIYAFHPGVLDAIDGEPPKDIGYDLLPRLVGQAHAVLIEGYFRDIGTVEAYQAAQADWCERMAIP
jgi:mannose-1-phosphate guanylyltransferase